MTTDFLVAAALLYIFLKGWTQGFLNTLLGPASFIISCVLGYLYFLKTRNLAISFSVCFFGPFLITFIVSGTRKLWYKAVSDKPEPAPPLSSRFLGAAINILWVGSYLVVTLMLIAILPLNMKWFRRAQVDVVQSHSYQWINNVTKNNIPATSYDINKIHNFLKDPEQIRQFESTPEFQAVIEDERLKAAMEDEETAGQVRDKNYAELLSNPKIQAIMQDRELLMKVFALNKKIMEADSGKGPGVEPKTVEVK